MIKILRVVDRTSPPNLTAIGIHSKNLSDFLQKNHGIESIIITTKDKNWNNSEREENNIIRVGFTISLIGNRMPLSFPLVVKRTIRKNACRLVHVHSHLFFTSFCGVIVGSLMKRPVIVTNHGLIQPGSKLFVLLQKFYIRSVGRLIFRLSSTILCYNDEMKQELINIGVSEEKIRIVPNGVDTGRFSKIPKDKGDMVVGFVGRLTHGKGIDIFLESAKKIINSGYRVKYVIAGDGPLKSFVLNFIAENDLQKNIQYLGPIDYEDVHKVYQMIDVFILPSEREGVPRSVLEAMACGNAVITTKLNGLDKIVGSGGFLVQRSTEKITGVLIDLLKKPTIIDGLKEKNSQTIQKEYSFNQMSKKVVKLYRNILLNSSYYISPPLV